MLPVTDNNIYHYWPSTSSCNGSTVWIRGYCNELISQLKSFKVVVLLCLVGPGKQKYRLYSSMHRNLRLFRFKDNNYIAQLVFPATSEWIKLELHIEIYKYILVIQIDDAVSIHSEAIQKFFLHTVRSSPLFDWESNNKSRGLYIANLFPVRQ